MLRKITAVPANQTKTQEPESQEKKSSGFYAGKISRAKSIAYVGEAKDSAFQNILKFRSPNAQVLYIHPLSQPSQRPQNSINRKINLCFVTKN